MKRYVGLIGIILSGLVLSLEIYMLQMIQTLEKIYGRWKNNALWYAGEPSCAIALIITIVILILSIYIFASSKRED